MTFITCNAIAPPTLTLKLVLETPPGLDFSFLFLLFLLDSGFTAVLRVSGTDKVNENNKLIMMDISEITSVCVGECVPY